MSAARFHVPGAAPGARTVLPDHTAHHAREVLRLRAGAVVRVFDGDGHEYEATLEEVTRRRVVAHLGGPVSARPESPFGLVLAVSPLRGDRMELVVQKATELGVAAIWPVVCVRTDAAARPALHGTRHDRWERVASGAAEQCGRAVVPQIAPTRTLDGIVDAQFSGRRLVFLETPGTPGLRTSGPVPAAALAVVGPAGGFEEREVERLQAAGFEAVGLGPRVLRAETAAVAAVTALQLLWGDLAGPSGHDGPPHDDGPG